MDAPATAAYAVGPSSAERRRFATSGTSGVAPRAAGLTPGHGELVI